jgi:CDP-diacylglycerol--serine O-phosphatidyltransferase
VTLGNAFCGLLAISYGIDALAHQGLDPVVFYAKLERACLLIFVGMFFDALDGFVARLTHGESPYGAQLDSFADAVTFGIAPALLVKILAEHENSSALIGHSRLHFLAVVSFTLLAILRLVRFNLEKEVVKDSEPGWFKGLPSPAAAGCVISTVWMYLVLRRPELELSDGTPTPLHRFLDWIDPASLESWLPFALPFLLTAMPLLGLLMVSNLRYRHIGVWLTRERSGIHTLVWFVFGLSLFYLAPVPYLFCFFWGFVGFGLFQALVARRAGAKAGLAEAPDAIGSGGEVS